MLGLGWPQWLLIIGLTGGLLLTFKVMVAAAASYERARQRRDARERDAAGHPHPLQASDQGKERP